jgi:hypothetical protein
MEIEVASAILVDDTIPFREQTGDAAVDDFGVQTGNAGGAGGAGAALLSF